VTQPLSRFDFYWVAHELHQADPERWATTVRYAQVVDWRAWLIRKLQLMTHRPG
jgi:hypothetical protein